MVPKIRKSPPFAPGQNVADMLRDSVRIVLTDPVPYSATSPATTVVAKVPANTLILGVLAEVTAAFAAAIGPALVSLGDSDGASDLFQGTSDIASTGFLAQFIGKNYVADQDLIATFSNASSDSTAGSVRFWLMYRSDSNKQFVG